jgi:hypothetical protein
MASPAVVGTRPPRARAPTYSRDSNALRASVLNVALELGVGTSRAVENLIFDSFPEEDEEVSLVVLILLAPYGPYGSPSSITLECLIMSGDCCACDISLSWRSYGCSPSGVQQGNLLSAPV